MPMIMSDQIGDAGRLFLDKDERTASLRAIHKKASAPDLYELMRDEYIRIPESFGMVWAVPPDVSLSEEEQSRIKRETEDRLRTEDIERYEAEFDAKWKAVKIALAELDTCEIAGKIKDFRDKHQAHLEMTPMGKGSDAFDVRSLQLTFDQVMDFQRRHTQVAVDLVLLVTGTNWNLDDVREHAKESAEEMWTIFAGMK
jgi:hypothetical protein